MSIVSVALDLPLPQLFDYQIDSSVGVGVGQLVRVPFGKSTVKHGVVIAVSEDDQARSEFLKTVEAVVDELPLLGAEWLALCEFCSRYYQYPLGQVIGFALPPLLRRGKLPRRSAKKAQPNAASPILGHPNNMNLGITRSADKVFRATANAGDAVMLPAQRPELLPELLPEQAAAVAAIRTCCDFQPYLLHGITGSGKTEVYLRAIEAVLAAGGQALMLVPEIALTPQLESRVSKRFPKARIVSAHSGMTDAARARGFLAGQSGEADIVLGTRLSVFMPLPRLQLIVIDEEHDASFKQQEGLRYSARDLAIFRAKQLNIPIVLGSATPSLETFHHAGTGRYKLLELTRRAVAEAPPTVTCVDTRREKLQDGMSAALREAVALRLQRGEQSLIFLNRRGYAPVLACPACAWVSRCPRCAANRVVHLADRRLRCHHCGAEAGIPTACPSCGNIDIHAFGRGTQRLESALSEHFPQARILRVDRDSASTPGKWQAMLDAVHAGDVDILIGTQMLAKGHDFPRLTLVGVVGADAALFAADFRAPERLFAQLMQVGGRSGRADLPGEVLIQTEYPAHPLYQALAAQDYASFARSQLDERQMAAFPPFSYQALLRAEAPSVDESLAYLAAARALAEPLLNEWITFYDPVPMRMMRLKNRERAQLLVESSHRPALQNFLTQWSACLYAQKPPRQLRWHLDVDPLDF